MEEKAYICKYCNKSFRNGRVLGGHMRHHLPRRTPKKEEERLISVSSSAGAGASSSRGYGLRENPKKSVKVAAGRKLDRPLYQPGLRSSTPDSEGPSAPVRRKRSLGGCCWPEPHHPAPFSHQPPPLTIHPPSSLLGEDGDVIELSINLMLLSQGLREPVDGFWEKIPRIVQSDGRLIKGSFGAEKASEWDSGSVGNRPRKKSKLIQEEGEEGTDPGAQAILIGEDRVYPAPAGTLPPKENVLGPRKYICPTCFKDLESIRDLSGHKWVNSSTTQHPCRQEWPKRGRR